MNEQRLPRSHSKQFGPPDHPFDETQFSTEVWNVLLGRPSNIIDCGTGTYTLKLNSRYTLSSTHYNDTFVEGFLRQASAALKMFTRLGRFASNSRQLRLSVDPLPMIPLRKAAQKFYDEMVTKVDSCLRIQMEFKQLIQCFDDFLANLDIVYTFFLPLISQKEGGSSLISMSSSSSQTSTIEYREEVEQIWREFFYKLFMCPNAYHFDMNIWGQIYDGFLEILPSYLDKVAEFTDIRMEVDRNRIVLSTETREECVYFHCLWTDRLFTLVKRAFVDRKRLYQKQKNPMAVARNWSDLFNNAFSAFRLDNPDVKRSIDIKVPMIKELLEKSCRMYLGQFSRLILGELQYHQRLFLRVKELQGIYGLQSFADQIHQLSLEDYTAGDRNALLQAYRRALSSPILPETTAKYWNVTLSDQKGGNPYDFRLHYRGSWPVNLIITQQFLNNMAHLLQLMLRLLQQYMYYRAFAISCMFTSRNGQSMQFTYRTQNFVFAIRQVLNRLYHCMVKKVEGEFNDLLQIVKDSSNFNDLETKVNRWHKQMSVFASESHFAVGLKDLLHCAEEFVDRFESISQYKSSSSGNIDQELTTQDIRQRFVLACESLALPIQDDGLVELSTFEREVSQIVGHITNDKFWRTS